jgi:hypothetical protein
LTLTNFQFVTIQGDGQAGSWLMPTAAFAGVAVIAIVGGNRHSVRDLYIQFANGTYSNNPVADGINVQHSVDFRSEGVEVAYVNGYGINIISDSTASSLFAIIDKFHFYSGKGGINFQGLYGSNVNMFAHVSNCIIDTPWASPGINIQDAQYININNVYISSNQSNAIQISGIGGFVEISNSNVGGYNGGVAGTSALSIQASGGNSPTDIYVTGTIFIGSNYSIQIVSGFKIQFANCEIGWATSHGAYISGGANLISFIGCMFASNARVAGTNYDLFWTGTGIIDVVGCTFYTYVNAGVAGYVAASCNFTAGTSNVSSCSFLNNTTTGAFATRPTYASSNINDSLSNFQKLATSQGLILTPSSASAIVPVNGGTLNPANVASVRLNAAATVTGVILAPGTVDGQTITLINEGAGSITFAASGSNVATGVGSSIEAGTAIRYIWSVRTALWYSPSAVGTSTIYYASNAVAFTAVTNDAAWHAIGGIITFTVVGAGADISVAAMGFGKINTGNTAVNAILQGAFLLDGVAQGNIPFGITAQVSGNGASGLIGGTWAVTGLAPGTHTVQFAGWFNGTSSTGLISNTDVTVTVVQK